MSAKAAHCKICGDNGSSIFCGLAGEHLERLEHEKTVRRYERGETVFYEGAPVLAIYHVCAGLLKLYKTGRRREQLVIRLLGPGDVTGYRALLAGEPYAATAEAVEPSTVCAISKETFLGLLRESPERSLGLLSKMAREMRISEEQMVAMAQESVRQRTARLLLFLHGGRVGKIEKYKPGEPVEVPLLHKEMAEMIGTTPETFSRTLHALARRGIIRLTRAKIFIENPAALETISPISLT
ncbi:MAG: Crp/Fnr family transcriptional regulator [candidate division Zixibacteria bacterium]|nr:Crp/Fnr family transcriptional regulator [candidate division Zixibacteria bacterium]